MIKSIKRYLLTLVAVLSFAAPIATPVAVYAAEDPAAAGTTGNAGTSVAPSSGNLTGSFCSGVDLSLNESSTCNTTNADTNINNAVKLGLNLFSAIVGIISVVMIIVGGIRYITSGGDSGKVTSAQNTVLYAVIGLVVVALAQVIVKFVLGRFTSTTAI